MKRGNLRGARLAEALPLLLVLLLAIGVVVVTFVIVSRTDALLTSIDVQAERMRSLADTVESAVARQSVVVETGLALTDPVRRAEYERARAVEDSSLAHLERAVGGAGPTAMSALSEVRLLLGRWHRNQDELLSGAIDLGTYRERLVAQSERFEDVVGILDQVKAEATALGAQRRGEIGRQQRFGAFLTAFLAIAAVLASAFALRFRGGIRESRYELMVRAREAEAAVRTRDEVLAIVSHDLRNGLNAISGSVELAQGDFLPPEKRDHQLELAKRAVKGMNRLISDLLDVARLEEGKLSVEPRPEPVQELFAHLDATHRFDADRRGIDLRLRGPEEPVTVLADVGRVAQVLSNLVGNALKFTPEGGRVTVTAERRADRVRFTVADTGPGIPGEHLPHIFDRFYKADAARTTSVPDTGSGLGLSIVRAIVERHDGTVSAANAPEGGAMFEIVLPKA